MYIAFYAIALLLGPLVVTLLTSVFFVVPAETLLLRNALDSFLPNGLVAARYGSYVFGFAVGLLLSALMDRSTAQEARNAKFMIVFLMIAAGTSAGMFGSSTNIEVRNGIVTGIFPYGAYSRTYLAMATGLVVAVLVQRWRDTGNDKQTG